MTDPTTHEGEDEVRARVVGRYSDLARRARTGETLIDPCGTGEGGGCFGADRYPADAEVPESASS
jgi:hypothetical protein